MKRYIIRILLCLFLGVVTTVGVAWVCALWSPSSFYNRVDSLNEQQVAWWQSRVPRTWAETPGSIEECQRIGIDQYLYYEYPVEEYDVQLTSVSIVIRSLVGWPFRCLEGAYFNDTKVKGSWTESFILVDIYGRIQGGLPTEIRFLGMVANILFWAALFHVGFSGVSKLKRASRKRRGRCIKCGYDIRGDFESGCPECGWNRED